MDGSPPGSPIPGILQARTPEWVAISFSNVWKWKVKGKLLSHAWLLATPWTAAYQAPPSMGFVRQEYWSGVLFCLLQNCYLSAKDSMVQTKGSCTTFYHNLLAGGQVLAILFCSFCLYIGKFMGFPWGSTGKEYSHNAGDPGLIPGLGRSPAEGKGYPLQYSGLENSMACIVHGVAKSRTWLSDFHFHFWESL